MYVIKGKNILLAIAIIIALIIAFKIFFENNKKVETMSHTFSNVIVVDAGHGLPDGGASNGDICESDINLAIAKKLKSMLEDKGYDVVMTREDENNIASTDEQSSISKIKQSDLNNRVKIINESDADFCISIHLNKFQNSKYWGWQTFYNKDSEEGKNLAKLIQDNIKKTVQKDNNRTPLKIEGIKIVDKTNIPVVIVECGFISNPEEAKLLQNDEYQTKLVEGIVNGVEEFCKPG